MRPLSTRSRRRRGFTVLEVAVAGVLITVTLGSIALATERGLGLFRQSAANGDINARAARSMQRVVREILGAGQGALAPQPILPWGSSTLDFQMAEDYVAGAVVWGTTRRVVWERDPAELDNDLDDDGDGLVDEGRVVLIDDPDQPGERRVVLTNGVSEFLEGEQFNAADDNGNGLLDERGLSFDLVDNTLTVRMSLERMGPGGDVIVRTQEVSLVLRN